MASRSNALDIYRAAYLEGVRIDLTTDGRLTICGERPSPALAEHLIAQRVDVLALAIKSGIGTGAPGWPAPSRYVLPPTCIAERACSRLGWCSEALRRRSCVHRQAEAEAA